MLLKIIQNFTQRATYCQLGFIRFNDHGLCPSAPKGARLEHVGKLPNNYFFQNIKDG